MHRSVRAGLCAVALLLASGPGQVASAASQGPSGAGTADEQLDEPSSEEGAEDERLDDADGDLEGDDEGGPQGDGLVEADEEPDDDPDEDDQEPGSDPYRGVQWNLDAIGIDEAWEATTGSPQVTVGLIDTGVQPDHEDLAGQLWTSSTGAHGFDHQRNTTDIYRRADVDWHGTAIAGVVAAIRGNEVGIAGVAPDVRVMVQRIHESPGFSSSPSGSSYAIAARGVNRAVADGADVLLLPWGGPHPSDSALFDALAAAPVPVVVAAGNDGQDLSAPGADVYPAMWQLPNLVTVAASDEEDRLSTHRDFPSNFGQDRVQLAAPGVRIWAPRSGGGTGRFSGTSFAAPHVAAALALGVSVFPQASPSALIDAVTRTARPSGDLQGKVTSGGVLDVPAFLEGLARPACEGFTSAPFDDVQAGSAHAANVACVAAFEVVQGIGDGRYAPAADVTRGQMATFLRRMLAAAGVEEPPPGGRAFHDTAGSVHEAAIEVVAAHGLAAGVGEGRFAPQAPVTRGQMATFLVRTYELVVGQELASDRDWFEDSAGTHERTIDVARDLGIARGTSPTRFSPGLDVSRGQMASFVARTLDAMARSDVALAAPDG